MFHVCWSCGGYRPDKEIEPGGPVAICPECGFAHPFRALPLLLVGGASGSGKSTLCQQLLGARDDVVLLDADIVWGPAFDTPEDSYRAFFTTWLRLCLSIGQAERPVVLFGAGFAVPANIEPLAERRYFSTVRYLALTCDDATIEARLLARPEWRGAGGLGFIEAQQSFNRWLRSPPDDAAPLLDQLDTSSSSLAETRAALSRWIDGALAAER